MRVLLCVCWPGLPVLFARFFCGPASMMLRYVLCFAASLLEFAGILHWVSQNYGDLFGGPHNEHYSIWGSIFWAPLFGQTTI